jgi:hypothetical protein
VIKREVLMKGSELIKMIQDQHLEDYDFCTVDRHEGELKISANFKGFLSGVPNNFGVEGYYNTHQGYGQNKIVILHS